MLYKTSELIEILEAHKKWLNKDPNGVKADLSGISLRGADLYRANLSGADLHRTDLRKANLSAADLRGADLRWACLRGADLRWANLSGAELSGADLSDASLRGANLSGASLVKADLSLADLREADLCEANLQKADMRGTSLCWTDAGVVSAGPIGSRHGITIYILDTDEVQCGCFRGTLEAFAARAEQVHADNPRWLAEYRAAVEYFKAIKAARTA
jgi:hypothetical protein